MSEVVRYLCIARLNGEDRVFLWEGEDPGPARVVVDEQGWVTSFSSVGAAMDAARANDWNVSSEEPAVYDIDGIAQRCRSDVGIQDCTTFVECLEPSCRHARNREPVSGCRFPRARPVRQAVQRMQSPRDDATG